MNNIFMRTIRAFLSLETEFVSRRCYITILPCRAAQVARAALGGAVAPDGQFLEEFLEIVSPSGQGVF